MRSKSRQRAFASGEFGHCELSKLLLLRKSRFSTVLSVFRLVRQLSACYEASFGAKCGRDAGRLVSGLVDRAFDDPRYTRYRYRPDCRLHRHADDDGLLAPANVSAAAADAASSSPPSPSSSSSRQRHSRRHRTGGTEERQAPPAVDGVGADAPETNRYDAVISEALSSLDIDRRLSPSDLDLDFDGATTEIRGPKNVVDDTANCGRRTVSASSLTTGFFSAATILLKLAVNCFRF
jgi:hypothetical protein